ncbi:MAG: Hsp20/alpha crystallin family protein [Actinomycetota bacterium]|nr:Hsp20/alpha crystallin family protein [Actinomycetota bacterium]
MAVINRWDPFTALARLDTEFDELVRRAWGSTSASRGRTPVATTAGYVPAIEMRTEGTDVVVSLELPGVDVEKDVDIEVVDGRLVISGQRQDLNTSEQGDVLVRELRYGSFRREFALPEGVGADAVEAAYDKGMLHVRVHDVTRPAQPARKIPISGVSQRQSIEGTVEPEPGDEK